METKEIINLIEETLKKSDIRKFSIEIEGEKIKIEVEKSNSFTYSTIPLSGYSTPNNYCLHTTALPITSNDKTIMVN